MKFTFRFESVLKIRRFRKRREEQKLSTLINKKSLIKNQIEDLKAKCLDEKQAWKKQSVLANRRYYAQKHNRQEYLSQLKTRIDQLNNEIKDQRTELTNALKQMQMIEKIRDRDKQAFVERTEHIEQLEQNEIAIQQFNAES